MGWVRYRVVATLASAVRPPVYRYSPFSLGPLYPSHNPAFSPLIISYSSTIKRTYRRARRNAKMLQGCTFKTALEKGERASIGVWQTLPGQNVSRILARTPGVDWVLVDCEHGNIDDAAMHEAVPAIASCGVSPIVRLPDMQGWMIKSKCYHILQ